MNSSTLDLERPNLVLADAVGKAYIGIDNGTSGAIACITPRAEVLCEPVLFHDLGKEKQLDVDGNAALLRRMIDASGMPADQVMVVFEQAQLNPKFGFRNNYTNGRNNEFWRVVLTLSKKPFSWVNPQTWQRAIFAGIRGKDTKQMADLVRRQRFPDLDLSGYTRIQVGGINDAVCIALWARQTLR
jgi:hypothetical protein